MVSPQLLSSARGHIDVALLAAPPTEQQQGEAAPAGCSCDAQKAKNKEADYYSQQVPLQCLSAHWGTNTSRRVTEPTAATGRLPRDTRPSGTSAGSRNLDHVSTLEASVEESSASLPVIKTSTASADYNLRGQQKLRLGVSYWIQQPPVSGAVPAAGRGPLMQEKHQQDDKLLSALRRHLLARRQIKQVTDNEAGIGRGSSGNARGQAKRGEYDPCAHGSSRPATLSKTETKRWTGTKFICAATERPSIVMLDNPGSAVQSAADTCSAASDAIISFTTPSFVNFDFTDRPWRYSEEEWRVMEAQRDGSSAWACSSRRIRSTIFLKAILGSLSQVVEALDVVSVAYPVCNHRKPTPSPRRFGGKATGFGHALDTVLSKFQYTTTLVEQFPQLFIDPCKSLIEATGKHVIMPQNLAPLQLELRHKKARVLQCLENLQLAVAAKQPVPKRMIRSMLAESKSALRSYYNLVLQWARVVLEDFTLLVRTHCSQTKYDKLIDRVLQKEVEDAGLMTTLGLLLYSVKADERSQLVADLGQPFAGCLGPVCTLALFRHNQSFVNPLSRAAEAARAILSQSCPCRR